MPYLEFLLFPSLGRNNSTLNRMDNVTHINTHIFDLPGQIYKYHLSVWPDGLESRHQRKRSSFIHV